MSQPTVTAILQAIQEAAIRVPDRPANIFRFGELREITGLGYLPLRRCLEALITEGRVEPCKFPYQDISGRMRKTESYRFKDLKP